MAKYLPKAEKMFQQKLATLLAPTGYVHSFNSAISDACQELVELYEEDDILVRRWPDVSFDFESVEQLFFQYGNYLLLIENDDDVPVETQSH